MVTGCSDDGGGDDSSGDRTTTTASGGEASGDVGEAEGEGGEARDVPGDEWETVDPAEVGLDAAKLEELAAEAEADGSNCFLVVRDGKVAGEWYWNGTSESSAQEVFSATKSLTSVLVGVAVTDGEVDVSESASTWITQWAGTPAEEVTVENLLSNDSGREWSFAIDYQQLVRSPDMTGFAIGLDQPDPPGVTWAYNNSAIQTLEQVIEGSLDMPMADAAEERIFAPLGMDDSSLKTDPSGNGMAFMGLQSTCRDMARFGLLVLDDGAWGDEEIVSSDYIDAATAQPSQELNAGYGYLFWLNHEGQLAGATSPATAEQEEERPDSQLVPGAPEDLVWAIGLGSQIVQVHEPTDTVVVRLGPGDIGSAYSTAKTARVVTEAVTDE